MIELTNGAITQLLEKTSKANKDTIRIGIKGGGCTGYEYTFDFAESIHDDDHILEFGKFMIVIDPISIPFLEGSTLDYVTEGLNSQFKFANPNVTMACGCGVSVQF
jgi:iron-sulfur cluster assembly accessory protein